MEGRLMTISIKFVFLLTLLVIIGILYLTRRFLFELIRVNGLSMYPTYKGGEIVLIKKFNLHLKKGDIVVVTPPGYPLAIKRIKTCIADKYFYVMGDNVDNSLDSRVYGGLTKYQIEGKVIKSWQKKQ